MTLVKRNPKACSFEAGSLKDWLYRPGSIDCVLTGTVKCPEGRFPIELALKGLESLPGSEMMGRQWSISPPQGGGFIVQNKVARTPYGLIIQELDGAGAQFGRVFIERASSGPEAQAFLYQVMIRSNANLPFWQKVMLTSPQRIAVGGGLSLTIPFTKDYTDYVQNQLFRLNDGAEPSVEQRNKFLAVWKSVGIFPPGRRIQGNDKIDTNALLTVTDTAIEVRVPCEIPSLGITGDLAAARGRVVVACTEPDVLAEVKRLRAEANPDDTSAVLSPDFRKREYKWRVVRIESDLYEITMTARQGPPGGPPGGPPPRGMPGG
jgi:hypothetical protein